MLMHRCFSGWIALVPILQNAFLKYQRSQAVTGYGKYERVFAHVGTTGIRGIEKFSITVGTMAAARVPATTTDLGYYKKLGERLMKQN